MDRIFLDANVLFSAAYPPGAGLLRLWKLPGATLITSAYALNEARVNLEEEQQRERLENLTGSVEMVADPVDFSLPKGVNLPDKDRPILLAAIKAKATHLLTGDIADFGAYFGRKVEGVLILPPGDYLRKR